MLDLAKSDELRLLAQSDEKKDLMRFKQEKEDYPFNLRAAPPKVAPKDTEEAAAFLRGKHESGSLEYLRWCLVLQREARGIPALAPTALASAYLTPVSERITKIDDLRRGMVAYSDDPNDSNAAGHIYFILGRNKEGEVLTWTNDAKRPGGVDIVRLSFYKRSWGDNFMFGATWLNGYDFSDFNKPAKNFNTLGDRYADAIETLIKIREVKHKKGANKVSLALTRDINRMKRHLERFAD